MTKKQRAVLAFVAEHVAAHGFAPSLRQTAKALGYSSQTPVERAVAWLVEAGFLRRARRGWRNLEVLRWPPGTKPEERLPADAADIRLPVRAESYDSRVYILDATGRTVTEVLPSQHRGARVSRAQVRAIADAIVHGLNARGAVAA